MITSCYKIRTNSHQVFIRSFFFSFHIAPQKFNPHLYRFVLHKICLFSYSYISITSLSASQIQNVKDILGIWEKIVRLKNLCQSLELEWYRLSRSLVINRCFQIDRSHWPSVSHYEAVQFPRNCGVSTGENLHRVLKYDFILSAYRQLFLREWKQSVHHHAPAVSSRLERMLCERLPVPLSKHATFLPDFMPRQSLEA